MTATTKRRGVAVMAAARFPASRESPHHARAFVADRLRAHDCSAVEDVALLMVSELVTNAVLHAETETEVVVECRDHTVRVAVSDGVPGGIAPASGQRRTAFGAPSGRGLRIVESLADRWGVTVHDLGKTVWFEVAAAEAAPSTDDQLRRSTR